MFFHMVYKSGQIFLPFCHNARVWPTDRRTDRQTDRILLAIPRLHYMQRGKNSVTAEIARVGGRYTVQVYSRSYHICINRKPVILVNNTNLHPVSHRLLIIAQRWSNNLLWQGSASR